MEIRNWSNGLSRRLRRQLLMLESANGRNRFPICGRTVEAQDRGRAAFGGETNKALLFYLVPHYI